MKRLTLIVLCVLAVGCSSTGRVSDVREATLLISYGDSKQSVLDKLGVPGDRSFRENGEAWQYCSTGFSKDSYATVWFRDESVVAVTTSSAYIVDGFCNGAFPTVDWGQMPAYTTIEIR